MKVLLLLLAIVGLACSAIITQQARKSPSFRAKMIKDGTYSDFLAQQHLARSTAIRSNSAVAAQPIIDYYDDFYFVDIGLGTPKQHFTVALATATTDLWVVSADCKTPECKGYPDSDYTKRQFNSNDSSTFTKTSQQFTINYGGESVSGTTVTDALNLAGLVYNTQGFGLANRVFNDFGYYPYDGILGLGWPALSVQRNVAPPIQNLLNQLDQPLFTIWFDRHVKSLEDTLGGLVTYGGLDHKNCARQADYVTLSSKSYWQFPMTSFAIGGYSSNTKWQAISDTGTSWLGAPSSVVAGIVKATGAKYDFQNEVYIVPCNGAYPDMIITIGGRAYSVPSTEYVIDFELGKGNCALTIFEQQGGGFGPDWTLGATWIRTYCNIYDVGMGRIGFAKAHHSEI